MEEAYPFLQIITARVANRTASAAFTSSRNFRAKVLKEKAAKGIHQTSYLLIGPIYFSVLQPSTQS